MTFLQFAWSQRIEFGEKVLEHALLTGTAIAAAILVGVPVGILIARRPAWRGLALGVAGVLQTIPSVAMLALLMIPLGLGWPPAVTALVLYALLPIIVNTLAGINQVAPDILEAAEGLGFTARQRLWMVELPLASPVILAGIRTSAVIAVGIATLSALIGAGGLGEYIFRGLSTGNDRLILLGVAGASGMALALGAGIGQIERGLKRRLHL